MVRDHDLLVTRRHTGASSKTFNNVNNNAARKVNVTLCRSF